MDAPLIHSSEGKDTFSLVRLPDEFEGNRAYLNATGILRQANSKDRKNGYQSGIGPNYGIEAFRAQEYARYVSKYATVQNIHLFNTKNYTFFVDVNGDKNL